MTMRHESRKIALAFKEMKPAKGRRTSTDGEHVFLHGNLIAWRNPDGSVSLTLASWPTVTTRERLNAICEILWDIRPFHQKKGRQYRDDVEIASDSVVTIHNIL